MRAVRIAKDSSDDSPKLSLTTVPDPKNEGGNVFVKIEASAIQPADRLNARGGFNHTIYPRIPGRDFSGTIVDGPEDRIGEKVFGTGGGILGFTMDGAHADYCVVPETLVFTKPRNLSHIQAASVGVPFTTAMLCLSRVRATTEDSVLVIGAQGAVGSATVQVAMALGCHTVLGAARNDLSDINTKIDPELKNVNSLTEGKGVSVIVDTVGDLSLMQAAIGRLAQRGRYAFIAAPRGGASTVLGLDVLQAYRNQIELIGCNSVGMKPAEVQTALSTLKTWFEEEKISAEIEEKFEIVNLENAEKAYRSQSHKPCVLITKSLE